MNGSADGIKADKTTKVRFHAQVPETWDNGCMSQYNESFFLAINNLYVEIGSERY